MTIGGYKLNNLMSNSTQKPLSEKQKIARATKIQNEAYRAGVEMTTKKLKEEMSNSTQNKCPFCNSELISLVLPSYPPQYKTHCPNCENSKVSNSTQNDRAEDCPEFGDYVYIPQKRYGCENEIYQYLVIECLKSNAYVDVPVQTPAVETPHKDIVPVVSCLCGGVGHKEVLKYRLSDIVRVEKNPRIADARREGFTKQERNFLIALLMILQTEFESDRAIGMRVDKKEEAMVNKILATLREEEGETDLSIAIKEEGV